MLNDITINDKPIKINRALISVYDKTNIEKLAQTLIKKYIKSALPIARNYKCLLKYI